MLQTTKRYKLVQKYHHWKGIQDLPGLQLSQQKLDIPDGMFNLQQTVRGKNANNAREKNKWSPIRYKMQKRAYRSRQALSTSWT